MTRSLRRLTIPGRALWIEPLLRLLAPRPPRLDARTLSPHLLHDIGLLEGPPPRRSRDGALDAGGREG